MVTRMPSSASPVPAPLKQAANNPPYPLSPTMPRNPPVQEDRRSFEHVDGEGPSAPNGGGSRSRSSSISSHGTWNSDPSEPEEDEAEDKNNSALPEALRPGRKSFEDPSHAGDLPPSLRLGAPKHLPTATTSQPQPKIWAHSPQPPTSPASQSQNPYFQSQQSGSSAPPPAELSTVKSPSEELAAMELGDAKTQSSNLHALRPAVSVQPPPSPSQPPPALPAQPPPPVPSSFPVVEDEGVGKISSSHSSNPWQEDLDREQQRMLGRKETISPEQLPVSPQPSTSAKESERPSTPAANLPPLDISNVPSGVSTQPSVETPRTQAKRQRNEVYQIKHINWYDATAKGSGAMRRSPIMTQNANGPCPLLALVNALSLSTPESLETSLVNTLKSREQITLGLLLDAVFEELVRRNETSGRDLPDIGDLYSFLITLHTGMNVNPAFTVEEEGRPGGFEQTKEMQLYGAFGIPLIHGWTAPVGTATYKAFERSAKTFDEALNLQFLEEELDAKLKEQGLTKEEQAIFEDMTIMKNFLKHFSTQLSDHGLDTIASWLKPGQIAILFRNDHFCTLYKEPKKGTLMTLVTDMGYATHDEVVWESLIDVNGALAEFFSGGFRPVGAAPGSRQNSATSPETAWQTSSRVNGVSQTESGAASVAPGDNASNVPAAPSRSEQEDLDLALALQLQEEEEDASRREEARRQHEQNENLSRRFLERTSFDSDQEQRPPIPPRRSNIGPNRTTSSSSPALRINSAQRTEDGSVPPPTYEQAASDMPYREAGSTPRPPRQGNALGALSALDAQRQQSAFAAQSGRHGSAAQVPTMAPNYGRRRSSRFGSGQQQGIPAGQSPYGNAAHGRPGEERCVVM